MTVGREIAGTAILFAAGMSAAFLLYTPAQAPSLPLAVCCLATAALMHPSRKKWDRHIVASIAAVALVSSGFLCMTSGMLLDAAGYDGIGILKDRFSNLSGSLETLTASLPFEDNDAKGIAKALITGDRTDVSDEIAETFRKSGASHLLALSGLHLGIICSFLKRLSCFIGHTPAASCIRSVIIIVSCFLYTLAAGAGDSLVRALIFIITAETGRLLGRPQKLGHILFCSFIIQCIISPTSVSSAGFQLSYAAMAGIAFIHPYIAGFFPQDARTAPLERRLISVPVRKLWNLASLTIVCQCVTAPIAYFHFRSLPANFLMANLTALPLTGIVIPTTIVTSLLHGAGICPDILYRATEHGYLLLIEILKTTALTPTHI